MLATKDSGTPRRLAALPGGWLAALALVAGVAGVALIAVGSGYLGGGLVLAAILAALQGSFGIDRHRA